jgi:hypothetical protein
VRIPSTKADPTEVILAVLILANHVITSSILLNGNLAFRTFLRVDRDPVGSFTIIITLFLPYFEHRTFDGFVPIFATSEAVGKNISIVLLCLIHRGNSPENSTASTLYRLRINEDYFNNMRTFWFGTPSKKSITFNKTVGN